MSKYIIISDTNLSHANNMDTHIKSICTDATTEIRLESFIGSISQARIFNRDGVNRSTTGLDDTRITGSGYFPLETNSSSFDFFVAHSHGDNVNSFQSQPSFVGAFLIARAPGTTYGPGVEFTVTESNQSNATSHLAGMMCYVLTNNNTWNIHQARQALRQTSTGWSNGHNQNVGFGNPDFAAASNISEAELYALNGHHSFELESQDTGSVSFTWINYLPTSSYIFVETTESIFIRPGYNTQLVMFDNAPTLLTPPASGTILATITSGSNDNTYPGNTRQRYTYTYSGSLSGLKYFALYNYNFDDDVYSRLESWSTMSVNLAEVPPPGVITFSGSISGSSILSGNLTGVIPEEDSGPGLPTIGDSVFLGKSSISNRYNQNLKVIFKKNTQTNQIKIK